jgi:hypothetical protein
LVDTTANHVSALPPVLGPSVLDLNGVVPPFVVAPGGFRLVMDATPLIGTTQEALLDNTALLEHYLIELNNGSTFQRFDVVDADYSSTNQRLTLTVDGDGPSMLSFNITPGTTAALQPAYFRVRTSGSEDFLPISATVQITLEATSADPLTGTPDPNAHRRTHLRRVGAQRVAQRRPALRALQRAVRHRRRSQRSDAVGQQPDPESGVLPTPVLLPMNRARPPLARRSACRTVQRLHLRSHRDSEGQA